MPGKGPSKNNLGFKGPILKRSPGFNNTFAPPPPPMNRMIQVGVAIASWSLVAVTPLFATVGLQTQIDNPPVRQEDTRQAVVRLWEPTTWDSQRAKFTPDKANSADPVTFIPYKRQSFVDQWTPLDWPTQRTKNIPTTGPEVYPMPHTDAGWRSVSLWPQDEWPTQYTRKVSTTGPELFPMPKTDHGQGIIQTWPQNEWPSQFTRKVSTTGPEVYPVSRTQWGQNIIRSWPQDQWDTQVTRKVPIPNAIAIPGQVPFARQWLFELWPQPEWDTQTTRKTPIPDAIVAPGQVSFERPWLFDRWPQPEWESQQTRKSPIPTVVPAGDAPPIRTISFPIYDKWYDISVLPAFKAAGYQDGPTVGQADNPPFSSRHDTVNLLARLWPQPEWPSQHAPPFTISGPGPQVDNPPPRHSAIENIYTQWEPRPLHAVWFNRVIDLSALIPSSRDTFYAVASTWLEPDYQQPRRATVTPSGPDVVIQNQPATDLVNLQIIARSWEPDTLVYQLPRRGIPTQQIDNPQPKSWVAQQIIAQTWTPPETMPPRRAVVTPSGPAPQIDNPPPSSQVNEQIIRQSWDPILLIYARPPFTVQSGPDVTPVVPPVVTAQPGYPGSMYYGDEHEHAAKSAEGRQHLDEKEIMVIIMAALVVMEDT